MDVAVRNKIITELHEYYKANGFITEDEALSLFTANHIPLNEIDSITEQLLTMGIIITTDEDEDDELFEDRSRTDYELVYNEIIEICPELEPIIEYLRTIARPLRNEWLKLMPQAQNGNEYARQRLFEMYLRVSARQALYLSKKYNLPIEDTLQDGFVGAISSVDNYNPAEHMSYATTIQWRINQSIVRGQRIYTNPIYLPVHIKDKLFDIMEEVEKHFCEHCPDTIGKPCDHLIESISREYNWNVEETTEYIQYLMCWTSLDELLEQNENMFIDYNFFIDNMEDNVSATLWNKQLRNMIQTLSERQQEVLILRYGLNNGIERTLEEVGDIFGVTRERIRQIENKALRILRMLQ